MPIYGYRCQTCDLEFEFTQRMSDPAQAACPSCGGPGVRLFFPTGILFKGTGFYKTDSRSAAPAAASANGGAAKPGGSSEPAKPAKETSTAPTPTPSTGSSPAPTSSPD